MKMKILGAAVATALLSVSAASFAQTGAAAGGQSNAGPGRDLQNGPAPRSGQGYPEETRGTTGNVIGAPAGTVTTDPATGTVTTAPAAGTSTVTSCDNLTGRDRTRCLRGQRASGGSSMSPQDQYPARQSNSLPGDNLPGTASSGGGSGSGSGQ